MDHRIQHLHQRALLPKVNPTKSNKSESIGFKDVLSEVQTLKISKHAKDRLSERNISIDDVQWEKISRKVDEAKQKGISDSLVVTNDAALLISAKNNTVVTAMDRAEASSRIFTNINGTILID
ncbi:TIGR02530 family flagellar biosynthesis protein [Aquibacillus rhizosphaerae]|uniref:TIGR02530 family flagellar biosynthesis protein n=1 Tax=Aquibacillus rhizosphaerae TaxID=3051431 RepID=A0ABT7L4G1_9BACI|nr:TIGR02530 family flagellar biosynthesis protein [Aquibacillus sp. LR5S19]MDL4840067.1 TIGR02530 family flagellar biosynthesis protein [Aquibacillus sp. LR5S19]